ncbi:DinB family protein [Salegentibacter salarius]|uniref:Metal-dependent hydrolase n=1 Tax=Salegentibacter salarius TaxID=435906 RepID=A0A2N0TRM6_9FLAO|nr:DinB family protein [Salegentibacter salarius]OEY71803.1 metal-dependent hydrolase [Salegentibacter salarius]PKD17397.1 metal-dependent hydrolase [Salegentibacter salarius]SLJ89176.1 DinB superfamily protein [Salegentibacter salarius]
MKTNKPEVWLRGKVEGVPNLLQPAAHALLQSGEEVQKYMQDFPEELLWEKPAGRASVGFHLQHLTGVMDRMLTYAQAEKLSENQFQYLKNEGKPDQEISGAFLVKNFWEKVDEAIDFLKNTPENILTEYRPVGRKELPSTVIGLLFHAAEHSQRHVGQLLVTVSFLMENREN